MSTLERVTPGVNRLRRDLQAWGLFLAVGLVMLVLTWGKWADVTIDFGRELYVPWRLAAGEVLYRGVAYLNGPLSPCLNAFLFKIFGVGFRTLVFANLVWIALLLALLYQVFRRLEGELAGRLAGLSFLLIFAFGRLTDVGNYNYVTPYSHELLHGMVLIMLEIWSLGRYEETGRKLWLAIASLLVGLSFLTKPEVFLAAAAAGVAAWVLFWRQGKVPGAGISCGVLIAAGLPALISWLFLIPVLGSRGALDALLFPWSAVMNRGLLSLPFYQRILGTDHLGLNLLRMLGMSALWGLILGLPILLAKARFRGFNFRYYHMFAALAGVIIGITDFPDFLRPLPLVLLGVGFVWLRRSSVLRAATFAAAAALLLKMVFNVHLWHYGFALAMPAVLAAIASGVGSVPDAIGRRYRCGDAFRSAVQGMWIALVALSLGTSGATLLRVHFPVGRGMDRFQADERGPVVQAALDYLTQGEVGSSGTLAVLPEGAMLNYLARLKASIPFVNFMPPEVIVFGEERMLAALTAQPPDVIALVDKDTSEYGFPVFGKDYGQGLMKWIGANYQERAVFGHPPLSGKGFGISLLRRREAQQIPKSLGEAAPGR